MKLLTLAKKLDFNTETEYFDYCKKDRKRLIEYIANCHPCGIHSKEYIWYWNIL